MPFEQPTRQSSIAILFILGRVFRILLRQLWVLILVVVFNPKKKVFTGFTLGILALAFIGSITSIISYFRKYYYIQSGELILEKGVLSKIKIAVPLDRIQSVNFKQSILHQVFNVVSVEIDTAGSVGKEFELEAIDKKEAESLRNFVNTKKETALKTSHEITGELLGSPEAATPDQLLFQLGIPDLLKIGVSQNHFRTAGIIMLFFLGFADDVEEALDLKLTQRIENFLNVTDEAEIWHYLLLGIPFFLVLSFLLTLFRTLLQYFALRFWRTENGFKMESGLFTRQEVSANLQKIQYLRWDSSPLKRLFRMVSVQLPQAASAQVNRRNASAAIPGCYENHLSSIRASYFPEENKFHETTHGVHWRIMLRKFFVQGIIPCGILMLMTYSYLRSQIWIWLFWLPAAAWLSYQFYLNWKWHISEQGIRTEWGVLNQHSILLQWHKVQSVKVSQNFFLRRRGLANLTLYTASGTVSVPYIEEQKAREVQDYVLFLVETDDRNWM